MIPKGPHAVAALVMNVVMVLVISKVTTDTLNPLEVFRGDSLLLKLVVGFFLLGIVTTGGALIVGVMLQDKVCAGGPGTCGGKPLVEFSGAYGQPVKCRFCGLWYHKLCYQEIGGTLTGGCGQPQCPGVGQRL